MVVGLGYSTTGRAGDSQGGIDRSFWDEFNGARVAGNFAACHEKKAGGKCVTDHDVSLSHMNRTVFDLGSSDRPTDFGWSKSYD